jgi:hypothetical protein
MQTSAPSAFTGREEQLDDSDGKEFPCDNPSRADPDVEPLVVWFGPSADKIDSAIPEGLKPLASSFATSLDNATRTSRASWKFPALVKS